MDPQTQENLFIGAAAVAVGISGWVLPYRYNLLRLRRGFARALSEEMNRRVPKALGAFLIIVGLVILVGSALDGAG